MPSDHMKKHWAHVQVPICGAKCWDQNPKAGRGGAVPLLLARLLPPWPVACRARLDPFRFQMVRNSSVTTPTLGRDICCSEVKLSLGFLPEPGPAWQECKLPGGPCGPLMAVTPQLVELMPSRHCLLWGSGQEWTHIITPASCEVSSKALLPQLA